MLFFIDNVMEFSKYSTWSKSAYWAQSTKPWVVCFFLNPVFIHKIFTLKYLIDEVTRDCLDDEIFDTGDSVLVIFAASVLSI